MAKFIKYLGATHLNSVSIAVYSTESGVLAKAEHVITEESFGQRRFGNECLLDDWFYNLHGENTAAKIKTALAELMSDNGEKYHD